jgi:hypothetical protein
VCILNARSVSIESQSDSKKFRENKGNLDQVQYVHSIEKRPSIEEPETEEHQVGKKNLFSRNPSI